MPAVPIAMCGNRPKWKGTTISSGRATDHSEGSARRMDLSVEFDFPETIVGSCHESSYCLAIVGSIVSRNSSNALLNSPGLT
jgi:hypothetical protein